jgi:GNAT superfamily N-acetyltransferase
MNSEVPHVPVVDEGSPEDVTGIDLTFVCVVRRSVRTAGVHALTEIAVGSIQWNLDDGEILFLHVNEAYRRKGVAKVLHAVATEVAHERGWVAPDHADERTRDGDAFALSMRAPAAKRIVPWTWPGLSGKVDG